MVILRSLTLLSIVPIESLQDLSLYINEVKRDSESLAAIALIEENISELQMVRGEMYNSETIQHVFSTTRTYSTLTQCNTYSARA